MNRLAENKISMGDPNNHQGKVERWWEFCPMCCSKLINQRCRFVCPNPNCHYFQSCSEFDT